MMSEYTRLSFKAEKVNTKIVQKKSILHIIPTLDGGGAERQLAMLASEQRKTGWGVHIGIRRGGVYEEALRNNGVVIHFLGDHKGVNPKLFMNINALIKNIKPRIVQTWLPQMDIVGGIASLWHSIPWIATERSNGLFFQDFKFQFWIRRFLFSYASGVVANSTNGAEYWREKLSVNPRVFHVANAVDLVKIRDTSVERADETNASGKLKNILVVGRLSPEKALDTIIKAIQLLSVNYDISNVCVSIIGEGPLHDALQLSINEAGLNECISLQPFRSDWWGLLKNASTLVSMSRFEGHPNVVLETMAAECPLIVSDILAHREFLDEDSAILVKPDNPAMLAEALISLLSNPDAARERAARAYMRVAGLTIQAAMDAYETVYEKVVSGRKK